MKTAKVRRARTRRAFTLVEVVTASAINVFTIATTVMLLIAGMAAWIRGESKVEAEAAAQLAVRKVSQELRSAMSVTVDGNGLGLTYLLPKLDNTGALILPVTWDGLTRRIQYNNDGTITINNGTATRTLVTGVVLTDPLSPGGTGTYKIFTPGPGASIRQVTIEVVTARNSVHSTIQNSRNRETIFLRNIPSLTK